LKSLIFLIFLTPLFACTGDCFSCHQNLLKNIDSNHKPMLLCKKCHQKSSGVSQCGADCFECHSEESISRDIVEHQVIDNCRDCHLKKMFLKEKNFSPFNGGDLRKFLRF